MCIRRYICIKCLIAHGWKMIEKSIYQKDDQIVFVDSDGYLHWRH